MKLSDTRTLKEISEQYNIKAGTLKKRLKLKSFNMIEGVNSGKIRRNNYRKYM